MGRIVASKEGITTIPAELAPRERLVKRNLDAFVPRVVDKTVRPKSFIEVDGKPNGGALTVNTWNQNVPGNRDAARGEQAKLVK
jgi:hypothetical protein